MGIAERLRNSIEKLRNAIMGRPGWEKFDGLGSSTSVQEKPTTSFEATPHVKWKHQKESEAILESGEEKHEMVGVRGISEIKNSDVVVRQVKRPKGSLRKKPGKKNRKRKTKASKKHSRKAERIRKEALKPTGAGEMHKKYRSTIKKLRSEVMNLRKSLGEKTIAPEEAASGIINAYSIVKSEKRSIDDGIRNTKETMNFLEDSFLTRKIGEDMFRQRMQELSEKLHTLQMEKKELGKQREELKEATAQVPMTPPLRFEEIETAKTIGELLRRQQATLEKIAERQESAPGQAAPMATHDSTASIATETQPAQPAMGRKATARKATTARGKGYGKGNEAQVTIQARTVVVKSAGEPEEKQGTPNESNAWRTTQEKDLRVAPETEQERQLRQEHLQKETTGEYSARGMKKQEPGTAQPLPHESERINTFLEHKAHGAFNNEKLGELERKVGGLMNRYGITEEEVEARLGSTGAGQLIDSVNKLVSLLELERRANQKANEAQRIETAIPVKQSTKQVEEIIGIATELKKHRIVTDFDKVMTFVTQRGRVTLGEISKELGIDKARVNECCALLADEKQVEVAYPPIGDAYVQALGYVEKPEPKEKAKKPAMSLFGGKKND